MCASLSFLISLLVFYLLYLLIKKTYKSYFVIPPIPKLDENYWWASGEPSEQKDDSVKPFKIDVSNEVLEDLQFRLKQARSFVPPLEDIQQQYGINTDLLNEIVDFWKTKYDWRTREKYLNQYPQFITNIQGLDIHFLLVKPNADPDLIVLPLLLLHGWPGSVREFYQAIPYFTTQLKGHNFVFEVVVPSLPGYGFSQAAAKPGLGVAQVAVIFKNLMERLGYERYYVQGGDWGSVIATKMSIMYPKNVLGVHVNMTSVNTPASRILMLIGRFFPRLIADEKVEKRIFPLQRLLGRLILESGYMHLQATKPDTVGVALNDSPVGLAAYILEKFTTWTNLEWQKREDGGLTLKFSYIDLLDNIMIYWVTRSITTSMRLYAESFSRAQARLKLDRIPVKIPAACARYNNDFFVQPELVIKQKYKKLLQLSDLPNGGHFAAFEEPQLFTEDVWNAIGKFQSYHTARNKAPIKKRE